VVVQVAEAAVVADCSGGQAALQSPKLPRTWLPNISVAVEHHGLSKPPLVVQVVYVTPLLVKGKTQGRPTLAPPSVRQGAPPVVGATVVTVAAVVAVTMSMMIAGVVVTAAVAAVVAVVVVAG